MIKFQLVASLPSVTVRNTGRDPPGRSQGALKSACALNEPEPQAPDGRLDPKNLPQKDKS